MPITQCDVSPAAVRENGGFLGKSFRTGREIRRFAARTGNAWGSQGQRPDSFDYTIGTDFRGNAPVNCLAQPNGLIVPHKFLCKKNYESGPNAVQAVDMS